MGAARLAEHANPGEMNVKEIYADFNDFDERGNLALRCVGSVRSINVQEESLQDGEEVCFSDGEVRTIGRVFKSKDGTWEGRGEWKFTDC